MAERDILRVITDACDKGGVPYMRNYNSKVVNLSGGSGTVGKVALELGRRAVLLELSGEYIELIKQRLSHVNLGLEFRA